MGVSDFAQLRLGPYTYIDKTRWVADVLTNGALALLVPRPRRFGKTLNMSTLRTFVERVSDVEASRRSALFEDTWIWKADDGALQQHFARYPVISLSFKDVKAESWEHCWQQVRAIVHGEIGRVWDMHDLATVFAEVPLVQQRYASMAGDDESAYASMARCLAEFSQWLHEATGEPTVILIDEYDAPLNAAWQHEYLDDALPFFRSFLSGGFKDNPHLFRGVLTGIMRVAKEGIFSGLNNLEISTILGDGFVDHFGFSEAEVETLAVHAGQGEHLSTIRDWYNGYVFGETRRTTIYNPWSVLRYLKEPGLVPKPFWRGTSDNALIRDLMRRHAGSVGPSVEALLRGDTVARRVDESVALQRLDRSPDTVIDLLFFSGYLTAASIEVTDRGLLVHLRIPNREVRTIFEDTFADWLSEATGEGGRAGVSELTRAILRGDTRAFERRLSSILVTVASYHDFSGKAVEAVYQALILGLLVHLEPTHLVRSNREAGYGRADVLISPRTHAPGAVLELKVVEPRFGDTVGGALDEAVEKLADRNYAQEIRASGATDVHQYAVVFDGKRCWIRAVDEAP